MSQRALIGQRLVALCSPGWLLFNYPLLALFNDARTLFGIPLLYADLFFVWALFIVLLCQKIRENSAWSRVKVVMLSAMGRDFEVTKGLALGADAYVTKPSSSIDLIEQVRQLLARNK
jgi:hypothetical protein